MFSFCTDPSVLSTPAWFACYFTTGKLMLFYASFGTVLLLLAITAPVALGFGFAGAAAARARFAPLSWLGKLYIAMVRGVPDIVFFLFFVIALDQGFEYLRHKVKCPDWTDPIRQGSDFIVCDAAKLPLSTAPQIWHEVYGFSLLSVIPNEHTVWYRPDQRLTRKMIPAPDAEGRGNTSPGRSVQIIKLGTTLQTE